MQEKPSPVSTKQEESQPSPDAVLPSSHCSAPSMTPSPHSVQLPSKRSKEALHFVHVTELEHSMQLGSHTAEVQFVAETSHVVQVGSHSAHSLLPAFSY